MWASSLESASRPPTLPMLEDDKVLLGWLILIRLAIRSNVMSWLPTAIIEFLMALAGRSRSTFIVEPESIQYQKRVITVIPSARVSDVITPAHSCRGVATSFSPTCPNITLTYSSSPIGDNSLRVRVAFSVCLSSVTIP